MYLIELLACLLSLGGYFLITSGNRHGFSVGLLASVFGLALFLSRDMYVMALLQVAYATLNLRALIQPKGRI